jgi:hypothetical protein
MVGLIHVAYDHVSTVLFVLDIDMRFTYESPQMECDCGKPAAPKRKGRGKGKKCAECRDKNASVVQKSRQLKSKSKLMTRLMAVPSSDQALLLEIFATFVSNRVLQGVLDKYDSRNDTSDCEDESDVEDSRHQTRKAQLSRILDRHEEMSQLYASDYLMQFYAVHWRERLNEMEDPLLLVMELLRMRLKDSQLNVIRAARYLAGHVSLASAPNGVRTDSKWWGTTGKQGPRSPAGNKAGPRGLLKYVFPHAPVHITDCHCLRFVLLSPITWPSTTTPEERLVVNYMKDAIAQVCCLWTHNVQQFSLDLSQIRFLCLFTLAESASRTLPLSTQSTDWSLLRKSMTRICRTNLPRELNKATKGRN